MKKLAMAALLAGSIATAGYSGAASAHDGWSGGGGYAGAAVVGAVAGLLVGTAVAAGPGPVYAQPVYAQPVYAQPVYAAPAGVCYDAYGRGFACAPPPPQAYGPGYGRAW